MSLRVFLIRNASTYYCAVMALNIAMMGQMNCTAMLQVFHHKRVFIYLFHTNSAIVGILI